MTAESLLQLQQVERQRQALLSNRILCCTVAGCLSGGAGAVRSAIEREVERQGRAADTEVCGTGCMGLCSQGPLVRSSAANAIYTNVTANDAPAIVKGDAIKRDHTGTPFLHRPAPCDHGQFRLRRPRTHFGLHHKRRISAAPSRGFRNDSRTDCG